MPDRGVGVFLCALAFGPTGLCFAHESFVQYRLVERTNQSIVDSADSVLNLAVQGRVIGTDPSVGIGGFAFAVVINGESPSWGTLTRDRISNPDGTYYVGIAGPGSGATSGIAKQHGYLVGINSAFNGMINASGGGWTQTPSQDIGLVSGLAAGSSFLGTPGVDTDQDGQPDGAVAGSVKLSPTVMQEYFGANGNWIDLFRFRYTVSSLVPRLLDFHIISTSSDTNPVGFTFTEAGENSGNWGTINAQQTVDPGNVQGYVASVVPGPGAACPLLVGAAWVLRRRRR